jgi:hypothetical protein
MTPVGAAVMTAPPAGLRYGIGFEQVAPMQVMRPSNARGNGPLRLDVVANHLIHEVSRGDT